ncbi:hypothetical protein CLOP_g2634 [Closterium sp. NIES-67]|nr:hypothetical protein CLOP_g2634 [Closterium sp. NIES-67]
MSTQSRVRVRAAAPKGGEAEERVAGVVGVAEVAEVGAGTVVQTRGPGLMPRSSSSSSSSSLSSNSNNP